MKKIFSLLAVQIMLFVGAPLHAVGYTEFPISVDSELTSQSLYGQYYWDSPVYTFMGTVKGVRLTFTKGTGDMYNGYPVISIAELHFYDGNTGQELKYDVSDIKYNSLEYIEGALEYLYDNDYSTYYHSVWAYPIVQNNDYVYLDVAFPRAVGSLRVSYTSRNLDTAPAALVITETGVSYDGTGQGTGGDNGGTTGGIFEYDPVDVNADTLYYVYLRNGGVDAYEASALDGAPYIDGGTLYVETPDGILETYDAAMYDSCSQVVPSLPLMTSYKFNNKYNANLNVDAIADSVTLQMTFVLNAIGKSLTASFDLSDERAVAYIDTTLQVSKESRNRFDNARTYVVTYPGYNVLRNIKVSDEVWYYGEDVVTEIPLTSEMLYTNKPSLVGDDLVNMLDDSPSTVFHTAYGSNYDATVMPYVTVALDNPVSAVRLYYMTRVAGGYNPKTLNLYAGIDGEQWTLVRSLTSDTDGMPVGVGGAEYTSPTIDLGGSYTHLKIEQTATEYRNNHMVLAEFRLYDVQHGDGDSVKIQDAVYETHRMPFGNNYRVSVDWLTDNSNAVPRIDIDIDGGKSVTSKDIYLNANFRITGYGVYDDFEDSVQIKGRGNSTWSYPKKPYRLKFESKVKPFGLTKGKSWVLLANYQRGSLLANAIAMKIGQLAEVPYANHIIPVELYMNGSYMGSYMFTEKVGISNNNVDIDDAVGYMVELDTYYDEVYKFKTPLYQLPVNVKDPDLTELTEEEALQRFYGIQSDMEILEDLVDKKNEHLAGVLDLDAAARFMLTNDLVLNQELGHPKSTYLWRESPSSKITLGPLWDFDWGFGYESTSSYCYTGATSSVMKSSMAASAGYKFFSSLMANPEFKKHYYKVWMEFVKKGHLQEVVDFVSDYYNFARSSFENNYYMWYDGYGYDSDVQRTQEWLRQRHDYIVSNLEECDITELVYTMLGDVNCDNNLTVLDIALAVSHMYGEENPAFSLVKADINDNGKVESNDVDDIASQVVAAEPLSSLYYYNTPEADAVLSANEFDAAVGESVELPLVMSDLGDEEYKAVQMDVTLPVGMTLVDAKAGERSAGHSFLCNQTGENSYRIVAYSPYNDSFATGNTIACLSLLAAEALPDAERKVSVDNVLVVSGDDFEKRLPGLQASFTMSTGMATVEASASVRGGDCLVITLLAPCDVPVYGADGRLVRRMSLAEGTTRVELPAGVYLVLGKKVVIL